MPTTGGRGLFEVLESKTLAPDVQYLRVKAPKIAKRRKPGQFVIVRGDIVTGGATVILAMGAGRTAAASIDEYLRTGLWELPHHPVEVSS